MNFKVLLSRCDILNLKVNGQANPRDIGVRISVPKRAQMMTSSPKLTKIITSTSRHSYQGVTCQICRLTDKPITRYVCPDSSTKKGPNDDVITKIDKNLLRQLQSIIVKVSHAKFEGKREANPRDIGVRRKDLAMTSQGLKQ